MVRATRSALLCTGFSAVRPVPSTATPTPMPTSRRALHGTRRLFSPTSRTPRSTFPAPRWPSVVSRRTRTATTSSPSSRRRPHEFNTAPNKRGRVTIKHLHRRMGQRVYFYRLDRGSAIGCGARIYPSPLY